MVNQCMEVGCGKPVHGGAAVVNQSREVGCGKPVHESWLW